MAADTDSVAMACPARSRSRWRRAMAMLTGRSPIPTPWRPRPSTRTKNEVDTADTTHPASTTDSVTMMTDRWRRPSASRPMTGVASAPVSRAAVRTHWAVLRGTW